MRSANESCSKQSGFSLVETLIATVILSGGLLALASGISQGMLIMSTSHYHQIAKEKASEALESVNTSRDTHIIAWAQIRNVSEGGIFLNGPQPFKAHGPDGLVNTADDGALENEVLPGPDGILGTGDDVVNSLNTFRRQIIITDFAANPNLRQIQVIITYQIGHLTRQYSVISYISSFA
jgi:prepilin-type N-terminal cleavage/methylation domain-containing protein